MAALPPTEVPHVTFKYGLEADQYPSQRSEGHTRIQKTFPRMSSPLFIQRAFRTPRKQQLLLLINAEMLHIFS